jgi:leucyl-tRNA synthetase
MEPAVHRAYYRFHTCRRHLLLQTNRSACAAQASGQAERLRDEAPTSFLDRVFENEINLAAMHTRKAYDACLYRNALKFGCFELQVRERFPLQRR